MKMIKCPICGKETDLIEVSWYLGRLWKCAECGRIIAHGELSKEDFDEG